MPEPTIPTVSFRVACFAPYPASGPSVRHRVLELAPGWRAHGIELTLMPFMGEYFYGIRKRVDTTGALLKVILFAFATLLTGWRVMWVARFDAVIIHREAFPLGPAWFERVICKLNPNVFLDVDDAIWLPTSMATNQRKLFWSPSRVAEILQRCKATVVGNAHLATYARFHVSDVRIVPTTYDDLSPPRTRRANAMVVPCVLWIGNEGNAAYLKLVLPALEEVARHIRLRLRVVGGSDIVSIQSSAFEIEHCRWNEAWEAEWLRTADVGIMPLYDAPYEQGKCGFKLVQYWSAGLPVIASPVGVNCTMIENGVNGFLAEDEEAWCEALKQLLALPDSRLLRARMGEAGRATYLSRYTRQHAVGAWLDLFAIAGWRAPARAATLAKARS